MFRYRPKAGGYSLIFIPAFMWLWGVLDDISNHHIQFYNKDAVH